MYHRVHCFNCENWRGPPWLGCCAYGWHPGYRKHLPDGLDEWLTLYKVKPVGEVLHMFAKECERWARRKHG